MEAKKKKHKHEADRMALLLLEEHFIKQTNDLI